MTTKRRAHDAWKGGDHSDLISVVTDSHYHVRVGSIGDLVFFFDFSGFTKDMRLFKPGCAYKTDHRERRGHHERSSQAGKIHAPAILKITTKICETMRGLSFALLLVCSLAIASACSCPDITFQERYGFTQTLVRARAVSVRRFRASHLIPGVVTYIFKLRLMRVFKGCAPQKFFYAKTMLDGGTCSSVLTKGRTYLVQLPVEVENEPSSAADPYEFYGCNSANSWKYIPKIERRFYRKQSVKPENQCMA